MNLDLVLPLAIPVSLLLLAVASELWGADTRAGATERRDGRAIRWSIEPGEAPDRSSR